ncbi:AIM24 family protein, partial [bacterium]|nr:AIM24 family protein [bacterium]
VTVVLPKVRTAYSDAIAREESRNQAEVKLESTKAQVLTVERQLEKVSDEASDQADKKKNLAQKIKDRLSKLQQSATQTYRNRASSLRKRIKNLEENWPAWYNPVNYLSARTYHDIKLRKAKLELETLEMGVVFSPSDDPLRREEALCDKALEKTRKEKTELKSELKTIKAQREELISEIAFLDGKTDWMLELIRAWNRFKSWIVSVLVVIVVAPLMWSLFVYYCVSWLATRQRPMQLGSSGQGSISVSDPKTTFDVKLATNEKLYLQSELLTQHDQVDKSTAMFWSWKAIAVSIVSGLYACTRVWNRNATIGSITMSPSDSDLEISEIVLEEDAELVVHIQYIVAIKGEIRVRAKWRFFSAHAWLTGQVRFLLFRGCGSIFIVAPRGVAGYTLKEQTQNFEQQITVGFDSRLQYSVRRTETFWPYLLGKASLFDDSFSGNGIVLRRNSSAGGKKNVVEKTLGPFFSIVGKLLGF